MGYSRVAGYGGWNEWSWFDLRRPITSLADHSLSFPPLVCQEHRFEPNNQVAAIESETLLYSASLCFLCRVGKYQNSVRTCCLGDPRPVKANHPYPPPWRFCASHLNCLENLMMLLCHPIRPGHPIPSFRFETRSGLAVFLNWHHMARG